MDHFEQGRSDGPGQRASLDMKPAITTGFIGYKSMDRRKCYYIVCSVKWASINLYNKPVQNFALAYFPLQKKKLFSVTSLIIKIDHH